MHRSRPLAGLILTILMCPATHASGFLTNLTETPIGTFNGVAYAQYAGMFEGTTATGFYRVPYQIVAPMAPQKGNRSVWIEPPHFAGGLGTLNAFVQRDFILGRGFSFAGAGWSSAGLNVLDRNPGFVVWVGGVQLDADADGSVDEDPFDGIDNDGDGAVDEDPGVFPFIQDPSIIADFGAALVDDTEAYRRLGNIRNRYLVGFSQTSPAVRRLIETGQAEGIFDGALTYVNAEVSTSLQAAIASDMYTGKLIVLNTEFDNAVFGARLLEDDGTTPYRYRHFAIPGSPHAPDLLLSASGQPTSPASFVPQLRAHFLQLHQWATNEGRGWGSNPPVSTEFERDQSDAIARDPAGNAFIVNMEGERVPRLPFLELGEATYISGFAGAIVNVRSVNDLGFASFTSYLKAFGRAARDYQQAGFMLKQDETDMLARSGLCTGATYTENYRDRYAQFVNIESCP